MSVFTEPIRDLLRDRTAVVTGGGRGIGAAVANQLATAGAIVLVSSKTATHAQMTVDHLRKAGHIAHATTCDVSKREEVEALQTTATSLLGKVDVLVNNAGVAFSASFLQTSLDDFLKTMAVNTTGTFLCLKAFLPEMLKAGWGRVINIASTAGLSAGSYMSAYATSKHAVVGLTKAIAAEVASQDDVTVNALCPGYVRTDMTRESIKRIMDATGRTEQQALNAILKTTAQDRLIEPEEVADAVVFLCREDSKNINGSTLVIDGDVSGRKYSLRYKTSII